MVTIQDLTHVEQLSLRSKIRHRLSSYEPCFRPYLQIIAVSQRRRFNKIAIQGTPQMAVDKEALICLSRVYSYYFKYNFPLFYVYPALTRYLSILFLNILTLLACTHSSDNLFHTLMVLCENENFLTSNLLCFFTRVKLCPLVILLSLIWKKKVRINIFITIQYLKHFYLIPPQSSRF